MEFRIVIPARYGSARLPGKPLRRLGDASLLEHVHRRACESGAREVMIATDDKRIAEEVQRFGGQVHLTRDDHPSGTDRLTELCQRLGWPDEDIVVNLQGDEPLMPAALVRRVAADLHGHAHAAIATVAAPITDAVQLADPNVVKVVVNAEGYALYFSRASIPWDRDRFPQAFKPSAVHRRHIGLYAFRVGFLKAFSALPASPLEKLESLEQLRALDHGYRIYVSSVEQAPPAGVDVEADLARVESLLSR